MNFVDSEGSRRRVKKVVFLSPGDPLDYSISIEDFEENPVCESWKTLSSTIFSSWDFWIPRFVVELSRR